MASIRKRGGRWQAQVRKQGFPSISRTFAKKGDATGWVQAEEARLNSSFANGQVSRSNGNLRLTDLLERYRDEVTPKKRGHLVERHRINAFLTAPLARLRLCDATPAVFAAYRDVRATEVAPETIRKELQLLSHMFTVAAREWGCTLPGNPIAQIRRPPPSSPRTRRLSGAEYLSLEIATGHPRVANYIWPLANFAIETAMRRGEMLSLTWDDIDESKRVAQLSDTKTGIPRGVPLSSDALAWLEWSRFPGEPKPFPVSPNAVRLAWTRLTKRAGIEDLHFHDLRHEAISRLFERGLSIAEVALISGHRDVRQLFRYTHLRAEDVAKKLR